MVTTPYDVELNLSMRAAARPVPSSSSRPSSPASSSPAPPEQLSPFTPPETNGCQDPRSESAAQNQPPQGDNGGGKGGRGAPTRGFNLARRKPNGQFGPGNRMGTLGKPPVGGCSRQKSLAKRALSVKDARRAVARLDRILEGEDDKLAMEAFGLIYGGPPGTTNAAIPRRTEWAQNLLDAALTPTVVRRHVKRLGEIIEQGSHRDALEAFKILYRPPAPPEQAEQPKRRPYRRRAWFEFPELPRRIEMPETPPRPHPSG